MKITFSSNFGPFKYKIEQEFVPETWLAPAPFVDENSTPEEKTERAEYDRVLAQLCAGLRDGVANTAYRGVGSAVEKALKTPVFGPDGETVVKPALVAEDTKRADIPYSEELAEAIAVVAQQKLNDIAKEDGLAPMRFAPMGQHEYGESGTSRKMAENFLQTVQKMGSDWWRTLEQQLGRPAAEVAALDESAKRSDAQYIEAVHSAFFKTAKPKKS